MATPLPVQGRIVMTTHLWQITVEEPRCWRFNLPVELREFLRDPAEFVWVLVAASEPSINPPFDQPEKSALVFLAFSLPRINALRGYVIENKSRSIFPSWTSPVRPRSPAPTFQSLSVT
jgi:hypothetical protein